MRGGFGHGIDRSVGGVHPMGGSVSKRLIATLALTAAMMVPAGAALAAPGGAPGAHGVDGRTFGGLVSDAAQTDVGWLVSHVSGGRA
jgi:hypothetical protein